MDFSGVYALLGLLPFDTLEPRFMRQALLGLLFLSPMTAMLGIHVLNFRMAFFSDAGGHSAFAGLAIGLILGAPPQTAVLVFGVVIGLGIMAAQRKSGLSPDAAIGIVFSAVVAFGLAVVSRAPSLARDIQQYLYGDILTVTESELTILALLLVALCLFEFWGWNRLLAVALSPSLARIEGRSAGLWQYLFAAILALVVMFSVRAVGVLLVTAMLVVPASAGRKLAWSMRGLFWWSIAVSVSSSVIGLMLSAQEWMATASGATIILVSCLWFAASCLWAAFKRSRN
ncbi:MAG: metal ABC transporter permease [Desulfovibrio sp.]|nr:metal ABC transporter permease [Desulfovibrio sp.]